MKNRYEKFVFEAEKGIAFKVSEGTSGELIIRAMNIATFNSYLDFPVISAGEYAEVLSVYTDNDGNQAVVPTGWTVSGISKENTIWGKDVSLVIYRIPKENVEEINWADPDEVEILKRTYDQFVWTPVGLLEANGTLNGVSFTEKFGRRNYQNIEFSEEECYEPLVGELALEKESVDKYGGYYSSRYNISKDEQTRKPRSIKGADPWTSIDFYYSREVVATMVVSETVTSHLMFGAEYDTQEEWLIETGAKTRKEIAENSTDWGNYYNTKNSPRKVVKTGSCEEWCANNIYDFAGNVAEWTQERNGSSYRVIRGVSYYSSGYHYPVDYRSCSAPKRYYNDTGSRATLCIM